MAIELQDCIVFLLAKNSQAGYRFWNAFISDINVTTVQAMFLILLNRKDGLSSREIGKSTQLDSATVTGILDRLESINMVTRQRNPKDRRAISVFLTDQGRKDAQTLDTRFEEAHNAFLESFSPEEELIFRGLLKRLLNEHLPGKEKTTTPRAQNNT